MPSKQQKTPWQRSGAARALTFGLALSVGGLAGCDSLLDVDLPTTVTDEALTDPATAQLQLNGLAGQIECGLSAFHYQAAGYEDSFERIAGAYGVYSEYDESAGEGNCDTDISNFDWYDPLQIGRASAYQLYDRIINEWDPADVANREQVLAQTALYAAISLEVFGDVFCEVAIDGGELMTPDATLAIAEDWVDRALTHIATTGDFELPNGVTGQDDGNGIEPFAHAIRARIRWARGNSAGALADIAQVPDGFTAFISREGRPQRRNKVYFHSSPGSGLVQGQITSATWDDPAQSSPSFFDPAYYPGNGWPDPIPFTGYLDLGILPNGRALTSEAIAYPVTLDDAGAVADTRVQTQLQQVAAGGNTLYPVPVKYTSQGDDMPLVSWRELKLIQAELQPGSAVSLVNELRTFHGLPTVSYGPSSPDEIENMVIEERRRELWLEGRFWVTKVQHTDKLWFPRDFGAWPISSLPLQGGVRIAMPESEYILNDNLDLADRATGCSAGAKPIIIG